MNQTEIAARLITIEAHTTLARAAMLTKDGAGFLKELLEARKLLGELCAKIVSGDETHIYVAG